MKDIQQMVFEAIRNVAPELAEEDLVLDARLQEDLDLDSMDFLDVVTELAIRSGVEIPERDYRELATVGGCIDYLAGFRALT